MAKLIGKDVQLIHTLSASPAEPQDYEGRRAARLGVAGTELRIGYGYPQISDMSAKGSSSASGRYLGADGSSTCSPFSFAPIRTPPPDKLLMASRHRHSTGATIDGNDRLHGSARFEPGNRTDLMAVARAARLACTHPAHVVLERLGRRTSTPSGRSTAASSSAAASSSPSTRRRWSRRHAPRSPACATAPSGDERAPPP